MDRSVARQRRRVHLRTGAIVTNALGQPGETLGENAQEQRLLIGATGRCRHRSVES